MTIGALTGTGSGETRADRARKRYDGGTISGRYWRSPAVVGSRAMLGLAQAVAHVPSRSAAGPCDIGLEPGLDASDSAPRRRPGSSIGPSP